LVPPYNIDGNGVTRGTDGTWDRGAYEFVSGGGTTGGAGATYSVNLNGNVTINGGVITK
jgi:hypothetical protein